MKRITIEIFEAGDERQTFDVIDEAGRRCDQLSFDEMLGQVIQLAFPKVEARGERYPMRTREEWDDYWKAMHERIAQRSAT